MAPWSKIRILYLLREISKHPDMTDVQLAKILGVSARTINRYRKLLLTLPNDLP